MAVKDHTGIVPPQQRGKEMTMTAAVELKHAEDAMQFYSVAKQRLLDVNNWHGIAGGVTARFQLVSTEGEEVQRLAQKGDYFKIDIPGPGSKAGDGYDWVKVEELTETDNEDVQSIGLRVRPTDNPFSSSDETAHFYSDDATSNFIVTRENNVINAVIVDRNVEPNSDSSSVTDKLRDAAVGIGAISIFSKIQWQHLVNGIVKPHHNE